MNLHANATILTKLKQAFGHWYITTTPKELHPVKRTNAVNQEITRSLGVFNLSDKVDGDIIVYEEIKRCGEYLAYRLDFDAYMVEKARAKEKLEDLQQKFVAQQLHDFDMKAPCSDEQQRWGWSPLYVVLKKSPPCDWPPASWDHTDEELECLLSKWVAEDINREFSLEKECPHILRAFKIFIRQSHGIGWPLGHPIEGLTRSTTLAYTKSTIDSIHLTMVVEDLLKYGWMFFPMLFASVEPLEQCMTNLLGLLGYAEGQQLVVLQKMDAFMRCLAQRAILDMYKIGYRGLLAKMWHGDELSDAEKKSCQQVFAEALIVRKDIDLGWFFVGERATMQSIKPKDDDLHASMKALMNLRVSQLRALQYPKGEKVRNQQNIEDPNKLHSINVVEEVQAQQDIEPMALQKMVVPSQLVFLQGLEKYSTQGLALRLQVPLSISEIQVNKNKELCKLHVCNSVEGTLIGVGLEFAQVPTKGR